MKTNWHNSFFLRLSACPHVKKKAIFIFLKNNLSIIKTRNHFCIWIPHRGTFKFSISIVVCLPATVSEPRSVVLRAPAVHRLWLREPFFTDRSLIFFYSRKCSQADLCITNSQIRFNFCFVDRFHLFPSNWTSIR